MKLKTKLMIRTNAVYAAMIEHLDDAVGKLIDVLEDENLMENTINNLLFRQRRFAGFN